jgi:hypothetical protein
MRRVYVDSNFKATGRLYSFITPYETLELLPPSKCEMLEDGKLRENLSLVIGAKVGRGAMCP